MCLINTSKVDIKEATGYKWMKRYKDNLYARFAEIGTELPYQLNKWYTREDNSVTLIHRSVLDYKAGFHFYINNPDKFSFEEALFDASNTTEDIKLVLVKVLCEDIYLHGYEFHSRSECYVAKRQKILQIL